MVRVVIFLLIILFGFYSYSAFYNDDVVKECKEYASLFLKEGDEALQKLNMSKREKRKLGRKLKKCRVELGKHGADFSDFLKELMK